MSVELFVQSVANGPLSSYPVLTCKVDGALVQLAAILDTATGAPIDWSSIGGGGGGGGPSTLPTTPTHDQVSCNDNNSTLALAVNSSRRTGSYIANPNDGVVFWVSEGQPAAVGEGFPLFYGGVYDIRTTEDVFVIQNSGNTLSVNSLEVTL